MLRNKKQEVYQTYISIIKTMLDSAISDNDRQYLILRPINQKKLSAFNTSTKSWKLDLENEIKNNDSDIYKIRHNYSQTNALAVSICSHDTESLEMFLSYVRPDQTNVWGYRQEWSAVHLAVEPSAHLPVFYNQAGNCESLKQVLDILKDYGADFNFKGNGGYQNPPLALPTLSLRVKSKIDNIKAELLLRGANTFLSGSAYQCTENITALSLLKNAERLTAIDHDRLNQQYLAFIADNSEQTKEIAARFENEIGIECMLALRGLSNDDIIVENKAA